MSQSARKRNRRRTRFARSLWHVIRLTAICAFVGLAFLTIGIAIAESGQLHFGWHAPAASTCNPTLVTTGDQGQPARWFSTNSGSAADIVSAVKCTGMYQGASQGTDLIARALQTDTLANPVLVKPYRGDVGLSQSWVVPVVDANHYPLALLTFFYNPQAHLLHEGEFDAVTGNMFYVNHPFPAVTASMSVTAVSTEQHQAEAQGGARLNSSIFQAIWLEWRQARIIGKREAHRSSIPSGACLVQTANSTMSIIMCTPM